ncbi:endonuclease/exonuclease/phosphatase family protein [Enterovirga sp. CN4-39]|uniref:endonuclease/exonuclease/phosphatase family protein n=1 Tax=Enterovirga sp. CN4-39 TaxID=3400910 RepID=UPI003C0CA840
MRLLTWNIQWGLGMDGRVDLARIVSHARELADPDVICLQEVADNMPDLAGSDGADGFAAIARLLPGYQAVTGTGVEIFDEAGGRRRFGNMVLSRLPLRQVLRHQLPWPGVAGLNMPRMLVETSIVAPFGPVRVLTTHLEYFSAELRALGVDAIRAAHAQASSREMTPRDAGSGPYLVQPGSRSAILTGDFNMRPADPTRLRLLEPFDDGTLPFVDAWTVRNGEVPHPHSFCIADGRYGEPHCADYILVTADLAPRVTDIRYDTETRLSDHQPVVLELR